MTTTAVLLVPVKAYQTRSVGAAVDAAIARVAGAGPIRTIPTDRAFFPRRIDGDWSVSLAVDPADAAHLADRHLAVELVGVPALRTELDPPVVQVAREVGAVLASHAPWTTLGVWRALLAGSAPAPLREQTAPLSDPAWPPVGTNAVLWLSLS